MWLGQRDRINPRVFRLAASPIKNVSSREKLGPIVSVFAAFVMKPSQFCRWTTGSGYTAQAALHWCKNDCAIAGPGATAALGCITDDIGRAPGYTMRHTLFAEK